LDGIPIYRERNQSRVNQCFGIYPVLSVIIYGGLGDRIADWFFDPVCGVKARISFLCRQDCLSPVIYVRAIYHRNSNPSIAGIVYLAKPTNAGGRVRHRRNIYDPFAKN
jgi:hypothetical protein